MKTFYLLRHEDINGQSGTGVVAEGIIFDNGMCAMCWLGKYPTVTIFPKITVVKQLHGHEGKTEVIIEGKDKNFEICKEKAKIRRQHDKSQTKDKKSA